MDSSTPGTPPNGLSWAEGYWSPTFFGPYRREDYSAFWWWGTGPTRLIERFDGPHYAVLALDLTQSNSLVITASHTPASFYSANLENSDCQYPRPRRITMRAGITTAAFLLTTAVSLPVLSQQSPAPDSLALARHYTAWFYAARFDRLHAHVAEAVRERFVREDALRNMLDQLVNNGGTEVEVLEEKFILRNGRPQYWRKAKFSLASEPMVLRRVISPEGEITGFGLSPESSAPVPDRVN
ncbi:MAG: hypothetical protein HY700_03755 [Gemmatimonadetes bacterium]|nr:hypothetical protein [Gemmatimonadota bacterium]